MLDVYVDCSMKESVYIEMLVDAEDHATLNNLSQYCIPSCFCGFTFCNPTNGIFGAQPGDMLHMFQLSPVKNCAQIFWIALLQRRRPYWMIWAIGFTNGFGKPIINIFQAQTLVVALQIPNKNKPRSIPVCCLCLQH